jgi:Fe-Mn family superoxide dismutase
MDAHAVSRTGFSRRAMLLGSAATMGLLAASIRAQAAPAHDLPPLPYAEDALEPVISRATIGFHYGKHHRGYLDTLNPLLADAPDRAGLALPELIRTTRLDPDRTALHDNAAQTWSHTFSWRSMKPGGGGRPGGPLMDRINADLGGFATFRSEFKKAAMGQFGSGWAWLVVRDGKLAITRTANAGTPIEQGLTPLLTIDVWEHAYYLDYQNRRGDYVDAWLDKLINWEFAAANLG